MIFQQYYLACLSHASYLIGDPTTGRAVVVDPQRDIAQYLRDAEAAGLTIERVIETHFHADFLSGHLELQARTGARISYGSVAEAMAHFSIDPLAHGQRLSLGDVVLEIRHTPGHTPESISIVVYEHAADLPPDATDSPGRGGRPYGVLTGDTLFIGDVGRPDLLSAAGYSAEGLARQLYHSLRNELLTLPDETRVFPAHGAGSACGKNLSTATESTIGDQRRTNYALQAMSEDEFVRVVTEGQSDSPLYFAYAAEANKNEHAVLADGTPAPMTMLEVLAQQRRGAVVLDTRDAATFTRGHIRGSYNVGLDGRYAEYAGDVLVADRPIVLVSEPGTEVEARTRLARIGFDRVIGALVDPIASFLTRPGWVSVAPRLTAAELARLVEPVEPVEPVESVEPAGMRLRRTAKPALQILDVRGPGETATGRIPGARNVPLPRILDRLGEMDPMAPTVVYCAGGYRSMIAASVMRAAGFADVSDLIGGFGAWQQAELPVHGGGDLDPPTVTAAAAGGGPSPRPDGGCAINTGAAPTTTGAGR